MSFVVDDLPADPVMLERIGRLRFAVWQAEGTLDAAAFPGGVWLDAYDAAARHWGAFDAAGALVAAARLTLHDRLADAPDGYVWIQAGRSVAVPLANLSKLVVAPAARRQGLGERFALIRIGAARQAGARTLTTTSSAANSRILQRLGFSDTALRVQFPDRPGAAFAALEMALAADA